MARKARKTRKNTDFDIRFVQETQLNQRAAAEGPRKKKWSLHDIKPIQPKTESQRELFESYFYGNHIVASGSAGTGKTYLSMWLALQTILDPESKQDKIIIVRSAVAARDIGFLPGTQEEKMAPFEAPYRDILADLIGRPSTYDDMKEAGKIQFMPTSFLRGLTWDNAIVFVDESQNLSNEELNTVMTRIGKNSRVIVAGDIRQNDLVQKRMDISGFADFLRIAERMQSFDIVTFTKTDVVRSGFAKDWIITKEDLNL